MKIFYTLILSTFIGLTAAAQSNYMTLNNRVVLSTVVNSDTIVIENLKNNVRINGEIDLLEVIYDNQTARIVGRARETEEERSDISIKFFNEYAWLDERIKTTDGSINFKDDIHIAINNEEQSVPANFTITRIRGGQGFVVMIEIRGKFSGDGVHEDFPNLHLKSDLYYAIYLTVQVVN